jgi:predicted lipid-binding transport protein (Tim44 family)
LADIADPDVATGLMQIKSAEPSFSVSEFLSGAKMAFDLILEAFAKGDKLQLENLLSKELYDDFAAAIDVRKESPAYEENTLVSIQSADIVRAALNGRKAEITVNFVSEQISVERDKDGNIVSGNPSETTLVTDEWTFVRDIRSSNPNWLLVNT